MVNQTARRPRWLELLCWTVTAGCLVQFAYASFLILREPYVLFAIEGVDLRAAVMLAEGRSPYVSSHDPAFLCYSYPILHAAIGAVLIRLGLAPFFALRLIAVFGELLTVVGAARLMVSLGGERQRAILGSGLLLVLFSTHGFHATARVDFLMLGIMVWAVGFLAFFLERERLGDAIGCALLYAAAPLAKQTAVIGMAASLGCAAVLFMRRGPDRMRRLLRLVVPVLAAQVLHGLAILALNRWTGGEYGRGTFRDPSLPGYSLALTWLSQRFLLHYGSLVVVAAGAALLAVPWLIRALCLAAAASFTVSSFRLGGDLNYALELIVWLTVTIGVARLPPTMEARLPLGSTRRTLFFLVATAIAAASAVRAGIAVQDIFAARLIGPLRGGLRDALAPIFGADDPSLIPEGALDLTSAAAVADRQAIDRLVREAPGLILAEEPSFVVLEKRPFEWGTDFFLAETLAERGLFDEAVLARGVTERRYARVFVGHRLRRAPGLMAALARGYRLVFQTRTPVAQSYLSVYDVDR
jgi:hypothetical protein